MIKSNKWVVLFTSLLSASCSAPKGEYNIDSVASEKERKFSIGLG